MNTIWITRELSNYEIIFCRNLGVNPIEVPTISIQLHTHEGVQIPHSSAWAFTSQHAVDWISEVIKSGNLSPELLPDQWFAIGAKTAEAIRKLHFEAIIPESSYGSNLANLLDVHKVRTVLHFTGNLARPELKQACLILGINYHSLEVYETQVHKPESLPAEKPNGIIFLSPSAVDGFIQAQNSMNVLKSTKVFAIGKTTASELLKHRIEATIPPKATFEALINFVSKSINK
ncbi:MAG: uroporphyrinogen-III synthase [Bacteroidetes bacterium]|nr:uroporphyrinogen-III synthase [Bacteroidota bacterium]